MKECPLGAKCENCNWYIRVVGKDPQSNREYDQYDCAINWFVIVSLENSQVIRGLTATTGSFRDVIAMGLLPLAETVAKNKQLAARKE